MGHATNFKGYFCFLFYSYIVVLVISLVLSNLVGLVGLLSPYDLELNKCVGLHKRDTSGVS